MRFHGIGILLAFFLLMGCASDRLQREGMQLIAEGKTEQGLSKLQEATKASPKDIALRGSVIRERSIAINQWLAEAEQARAASQFEQAAQHYQQVLKFEPGNERAMTGLESIATAKDNLAQIGRAKQAYSRGAIESAKAQSELILRDDPANAEVLGIKQAAEKQLALNHQELPTLTSLYKKPVSLSFRDANLKMLFELLSKDTGINFILDKEVRSDLKSTIFIKNAGLEDAVDLLLSTNQLEKKILNQNTVLIYPATDGKVKEYQDLVMKGFYISSADVKQVQGMIKSMLNAKNVNVDERLRLLIIRDTPEMVALAEKIIAMQDISEPEVMLEVEVLEVQRTKLQNLGIQFPNQLSLSPLAANGSNLTLEDLKSLDSTQIGASINPLVINARRQDDDVSILANPKIRARNREKAKILIGDKVPVITSTSTSTGFVSESVQYLDVGLKLEIEPDIYQNNDIAIRVALEVSSIVREIRSNSGTLTYQIGTRNASSLLQLKDGETQILAGLINDQENVSTNKVPGLGSIPLLGRLFSSKNTNNQKTEIVLSITPRLIRNVRGPQEALQGFWSGTDGKVRTRPLTVQSMGENLTEVNPAAKADSVQVAAIDASSQAPVSVPMMEGVKLEWQSPATAKVGEEFKVALRIQSGTVLRSMPLQIGFDPKVLKVLEVKEGEFFKQNGAKTITNSNIDQSGGRVFAGISATEDGGASGEAGLMVVTFRSLAPAETTEIRLVSATPVAADKSAVVPKLPAPLSVNVTE